MVLWRPSDGGRAGREVWHTHPLLLGTHLTSANVGLDGCGNVWRPRVQVQFRVIVWWRVDHQLDRGSCFPGGIGCNAGELSRILKKTTKSFCVKVSLKSRDHISNQPKLYLHRSFQDVQWPVFIADGSGRVPNELPIRADPVGWRLRITNRFAAQADLLTFHHKHLGGVTCDHWRLTDKLLLQRRVGCISSDRVVGYCDIIQPKIRIIIICGPDVLVSFSVEAEAALTLTHRPGLDLCSRLILLQWSLMNVSAGLNIIFSDVETYYTLMLGRMSFSFSASEKLFFFFNKNKNIFSVSPEVPLQAKLMKLFLWMCEVLWPHSY